MANVIPLPYQPAHPGDDHTTTVIRRFMYAVCIAAVLATAGIMLYTSGGALDEFPWSMLALSTPYIALIVLGRLHRTRACAVIFLVSSLLLGSFGVYALLDALVFDVHSTSALIYLSLPIAQWVGVIITEEVTRYAARFAREHTL
jgi:hypothetical protein